MSGIFSIFDGKLFFVVRKIIFFIWNFFFLNRLKLWCLEERLLNNSDVVMLSYVDVIGNL